MVLHRHCERSRLSRRAWQSDPIKTRLLRHFIPRNDDRAYSFCHRYAYRQKLLVNFQVLKAFNRLSGLVVIFLVVCFLVHHKLTFFLFCANLVTETGAERRFLRKVVRFKCPPVFSFKNFPLRFTILQISLTDTILPTLSFSV